MITSKSFDTVLTGKVFEITLPDVTNTFWYMSITYLESLDETLTTQHSISAVIMFSYSDF